MNYKELTVKVPIKQIIILEMPKTEKELQKLLFAVIH